MRQKKNSKIILAIIILLVIFILLTGIAYAYFVTDVFKDNKKLFFKYVTQMGEEEEGFIDTQVKQYFEKQKTTPYLDEGSIAIQTTASSNNNMNITFDGQVDTVNSQVTQNISVNYSDSVKFPFSYKQIGNTLGVQTNYIGNKYVVINKEALQKQEGNEIFDNNQTMKYLEGLGKIQEFLEISLTKEDFKHVQDTYLDVLNQELQDSDFSKIEEADSKGYKLTLKGENLKRTLVKLLETLKNDQMTLDKMNEYVKVQRNSLKITASSIDNLIKDINNDVELNNENLEITIYQAKGKTTQLLVKSKEAEFKLEKILTGNDQQYNFVLQLHNNNRQSK